ncbi:2-(1,2-epoxy-1,2-dihydrophenyl)acetyl-CoA isomerase PaaG [Terrimonas sp. NA20]|uniref:2-(1,2-epoxy-1,2-dihydrophenyl)acetyl-CoA isomerase PaaG n=1 Tax=Terrimonas ginsenosidimutans TaxID=2908004 RepID=A0ABS9KUV7_9BACT|nr:enoyl-CoA hydratase-related protein [Terrimonas ginsenosidimutans]MCG2616113.1 2-(1,2-epoxy-1,2-dihydrophenyl)acetyl-CoA isomerase PaaG [Terrimonas ginsenosidimutans]
MSSILFEIDQQVATITLNRPDKLNSFNREMALLMQDKLDACKDEQVRCVCITGSGKAFSAGQDLAEVTDPEGPGMQRILSEHYNPIITRIRNLEKPVVAAVNGVAAGAGANIALCCDLVIAASSASFIQAFSKIGLIPDSGGTYFLPRLIGWQKASALMMMGEKITAADAEKAGMIYKVAEDTAFTEQIKQTTSYLAAMPTKGLAYTKKVLSLSFSNTLDQQLLAEDDYQQKSAQTEDYKEGVNAFLEKRKPSFKGK